MKLAFTRLLVTNFAECFRFYHDLMGFQAAFGNENDVYSDFNTGATTLALFKRDLMAQAIGTTTKPPRADSQDSVALIFETENVDEMCRQLKTKGVRFITEPTDQIDWGIRAAHFRDPDGNLIEIFTNLPR
jgi:catechol 2,3-dioxygenase-like lactoylglutathione lyase family enzyme